MASDDENREDAPSYVGGVGEGVGPTSLGSRPVQPAQARSSNVHPIKAPEELVLTQPAETPVLRFTLVSTEGKQETATLYSTAKVDTSQVNATNALLALTSLEGLAAAVGYRVLNVERLSTMTVHLE